MADSASIHQFYDLTSILLRYQSFDVRRDPDLPKFVINQSCFYFQPTIPTLAPTSIRPHKVAPGSPQLEFQPRRMQSHSSHQNLTAEDHWRTASYN